MYHVTRVNGINMRHRLCVGRDNVMEGSEMSEVILKKIVTKLLLYTKPKMLSEIEARVKNNKDEVKISPEEIKEGMSHINTDLIFALNSLVFLLG